MKPIRVKLSEAAKLLGCSYRKMQYDALSGKIPSILTDTGRRFISMEWIEKQGRLAMYGSNQEKQRGLEKEYDLSNGLCRFSDELGATIKPDNAGYGILLQYHRENFHATLSLLSENKVEDWSGKGFTIPKIKLNLLDIRAIDETASNRWLQTFYSWMKGGTCILLPEYGLALKREAIKDVFAQASEFFRTKNKTEHTDFYEPVESLLRDLEIQSLLTNDFNPNSVCNNGY